MFKYLVKPHVCLSVSVHVAFYFKLGFGREGRGFESGSWLCFGGSMFFKMGWFCYEVLGGLVFIKGTFCLLIFFSVFWCNLIFV